MGWISSLFWFGSLMGRKLHSFPHKRCRDMWLHWPWKEEPCRDQVNHWDFACLPWKMREAGDWCLWRRNGNSWAPFGSSPAVVSLAKLRSIPRWQRSQLFLHWKPGCRKGALVLSMRFLWNRIMLWKTTDEAQTSVWAFTDPYWV